ncbi:MAG: tRNA (N6-isopentenyl adenosine(37)-C2)-methylthiotransferase MiaB [Elusimicrobiota bacterium]|jgi:tRNA-2-methylthio-N6-dimethylallyladenosine synthase
MFSAQDQNQNNTEVIKKPLRYTIITYGCQMNVADSEEMAQPLKDRGFVATVDPAEADIILMNTCTVRDQAEHRAKSNLGRLKDWKEAKPDRILIVAGCAASRWGKYIQEKYPFIDLVWPATQIEKFPEMIADVLKERWNWERETKGTFGDVGADRCPPGNTGNLFGDTRTAFITVMRGCNLTCSYCIVPQVRGRGVSRPKAQILEDVQRKVAEGYRDAMLLGQTVNQWGEPGHDFADLLRAAAAIEGVEVLRFMSPHPRFMSDRLIEAMAACRTVARHIHLPVQTGSDRLLSSMRRLYTRPEYLDVVSKLRKAMPDILITTDFIVGYPGETETDFRETLSLLENVRFNGVFAFKYSPRPGTSAACCVDDVPQAVKEERLQTVFARNRELKGETSRT